MMSCERDFRVGQRDGTPQLVDGPVLFRPTSWSPVWRVLFLRVNVVGVRLGGGAWVGVFTLTRAGPVMRLAK